MRFEDWFTIDKYMNLDEDGKRDFQNNYVKWYIIGGIIGLVFFLAILF